MSRTKVQMAPVSPVQLTARELEMAVYGLKIWRQVLVAEGFAEATRGDPSVVHETIVDIDLTLDKLDRAKGK